MKIKLLAVILCVLLLCSCSILTDVENTPSPSVSPSPESSPTATPDYTESWASAKKLVWVSDGVGTLGADRQIFIDFNNMLLDKGADFIVEFVDIDSFDFMEYQTYIRDMKNQGRQADLINTGVGESGVEFNTFVEAVKDGLLEPLDDFLETKEGQKLYNSFDENAWESVKTGNKIYGINNKASLATSTYLHINKEVQEKYSIQLPEALDNLTNLESAFELITRSQVSLDEDEPIIPLDNYLPRVKDMIDCAYMDSGIAVKYDEKGFPLAFNLFEEAEFISLMELAYDYIDRGLIRIDQRAFDNINNGFFFATIDRTDPEEFYDGKLLLSRVIDVVSYKLSEGYVIGEKNRVNGIASWSQNKEEAFKLLTMINTDSDLSNLLRYGIVDKHYELVNGKVSELDLGGRPPGYFSPANKIITHPIGLEPTNKTEVYKELNAASIMSPIAGFTLDKSKIDDKLAAIKGIYDKYEKIYTGEAKNIKEELKNANRELKDQGIDEVLDEINLQLTGWWTEKENSR